MGRMMQFKFFVGVALFASAASPLAAQVDAHDLAAIEAISSKLPGRPTAEGKMPSPSLAVRMRETGVTAVSIAYFDNGRIRWARAFGETTTGSRQTVGIATRFQAASLSKTVAAAGALQAVDRGKLELDENLAKRLKKWKISPPSTAVSVTLRHLLSHTGGVNVSGYPGYPSGQPLPTLDQSLAGQSPSVTPAVSIGATPGSQFVYSGGGYSIVQKLLGETLGGGFERGIEHGVLARAGMWHSTFRQHWPGTEGGDYAWGHSAKGQAVAGGAHAYPELAAAGLWTTPTDYAHFLIGLQNSWFGEKNALLGRETARIMMTPVLEDYGLGVRISTRDGRRAIAHSGANEGFVSQYVAHLDGEREGVVIMTNGDNGGALIGPILGVLAMHYDWMRASKSDGSGEAEDRLR